jgi:hypothetical protein
MAVEVHFEDIESVILKELGNSKKQIIVAVAWLTNQKLFDMLCLMADNYVDVQILIIKDEININSNCDYEKLVKAGGKVYWQEDGRSLMHHKYCVIDKNIVITGSYNWTNKAENNIENISILRNEINASEKYLNEFKNLLPSYSEAVFYDSGFKPAEYFDTHEKRHSWFSGLTEDWKSTLLYYADSYLWDKPGNSYWDYEIEATIVKEMEYEKQLEAIFLIKEIICSGKHSLKPLEHLTNLEIIHGTGNYNRNGDDISDLSPLRNLINLKELNLEGCYINDLKPLKKLKKITELKLSHNPLKSLDGIQDLERIKILWINNCNLTSLNPINKYRKLEDFRFGNNNIFDISFIANNSRLKRLEFPNNKVQEINHLSNCSALENLTFYNNQVTDIDELSKLKNLKIFYPSGNPISEFKLNEFKKKSKAFISDFNRQ